MHELFRLFSVSMSPFPLPPYVFPSEPSNLLLPILPFCEEAAVSGRARLSHQPRFPPSESPPLLHRFTFVYSHLASTSRYSRPYHLFSRAFSLPVRYPEAMSTACLLPLSCPRGDSSPRSVGFWGFALAAESAQDKAPSVLRTFSGGSSLPRCRPFC